MEAIINLLGGFADLISLLLNGLLDIVRVVATLPQIMGSFQAFLPPAFFSAILAGVALFCTLKIAGRD